MEGHCSTGQKPLWAVETMGEDVMLSLRGWYSS